MTKVLKNEIQKTKTNIDLSNHVIDFNREQIIQLINKHRHLFYFAILASFGVGFFATYKISQTRKLKQLKFLIKLITSVI